MREYLQENNGKLSTAYKLAIVGHGRSGKDEAAAYLAQRAGLSFDGSVSWHMLPYMAKKLGLCLMTAWDTRHEHRERWREEIDRYRKGDPARIIREMVDETDIVSGIRPTAEFDAAVQEGLITDSVFIHRPGIPIDPTLEIQASSCDHFITNDGSLHDFRSKLAVFAENLHKTALCYRKPTSYVHIELRIT